MHRGVFIVALVVASVSVAQRKPVRPPGQPEPVPEEKKPEAPAIPADEARPDAGAAAQTPVPAPKQTPATTPAPAPPPPAKSPLPAPAAKPAAIPVPVGPPPPPPAELAFRKRFGGVIGTLHVKPGLPVPGGAMEVVFELARRLDSADPVFGDRRPIEGANLSLRLHKEGSAPLWIALHPLENAGEYGARFSAPERGQWTLTVADVKKPDEERASEAINGEFNLGIGERTQGAGEGALDRDASSRGPFRGRGDSESGGLRVTMRSLGGAWTDLIAAIARPETSTKELSVLTKTIHGLSGQVKGKAPASIAGSSSEFNVYGERLEAATADLEKNIGNVAQVRRTMLAIENAQCLLCHVRFRYRITDDVTQWPQFTVKAPPSSTSRLRRP